MRKLCLFFAFCTFFLVACANTQDPSMTESTAPKKAGKEENHTMTARVTGIEEGCVYVAPMDDSYEGGHIAVVTPESGKIAVDDILEITYSGEVDDGTPPSLSGISKIKNLGHLGTASD